MPNIQSASIAVLLGLGGIAAAPQIAQAQISVGIGIGVRVAPPLLPIYAQPPIPGYGYIWTPGYWAWNAGVSDYYWAPGDWVQPPRVGFLWTPPWWGWNNGVYAFNAGYWGSRVGFYGGVNYGYGYNGYGYEGGYWRGRNFFYNRAVNNIRGVHINNVYNRTVINRVNSRVSYNGGVGGLADRPTVGQLAAARLAHVPPTSAQLQHRQLASANRAQFAKNNHGAPPIAATQKATVSPRVTAASHVSSARHTAAASTHTTSAAHYAATRSVHHASAVHHSTGATAHRSGVTHRQHHYQAPAVHAGGSPYHASSRGPGAYGPVRQQAFAPARQAPPNRGGQANRGAQRGDRPHN